MNHLDGNCDCELCRNGLMPKWITVCGAGSRVVNGEYEYNGERNGASWYVKKGDWWNMFPKVHLTVHAMSWRLSTVPDHQEHGTGSDIVYYTARYSHINSNDRMPPKTGWTTRTGGEEPTPTLIYESPILGRRTADRSTNGHATILANSSVFHKSVMEDLDTLLSDSIGATSFIPDQEKVQAALFRFVFSRPCKRVEARKEAQDMITRCRLKERLSSLELAVWKAVCIVHHRPNVDDNNSEDSLSQSDDDWKVLKPQFCRANETYIIMTSILPFLI